MKDYHDYVIDGWIVIVGIILAPIWIPCYIIGRLLSLIIERE